MDKAQIQDTLAIADEHFGGNVKKAAAAHVAGLGRVKMLGRRLNDHLDDDDKAAIAKVAAELEGARPAKTTTPAAAAPPKTPVRSRKPAAKKSAGKKPSRRAGK